MPDFGPAASYNECLHAKTDPAQHRFRVRFLVTGKDPAIENNFGGAVSEESIRARARDIY